MGNSPQYYSMMCIAAIEWYNTSVNSKLLHTNVYSLATNDVIQQRI